MSETVSGRDDRAIRDVTECLRRFKSTIIGSEEAMNCPASGAYALLIRLDSPVSLQVGRLGHCRFPAGHYAYGGNARGAGGIGARLRRHMRTEKRAHWHIDHLTPAGSGVAAWALPGGSECDIVDALLSIRQSRIPVPGFGASDCARCRAHLVRLGTPAT